MLGVGLEGGDLPPGFTTRIIATTGGQVPNAATSIANNFTSRRADHASPQGDVTDLRCVDFAVQLQNSGGPAGAVTQHVIKRYCEYPEGIFHRVYWDGAGSRAMGNAAGSTHVSDIVLSSVTGRPLFIPAGTRFWWRTVNITGSTVASFPVVQRPASSVALGIEDGNGSGDQGSSGTVAPSSTVNSFGPAAVLGTVLSGRARAFLVIGDSLADGQGDVSGVGPRDSSGWIARGLAGSFALCKITRPGQYASNLAASSTSMTAFLAALSGAYTDVVNEPGLNDLSQSGASATQIVGWRQAIDAKLDSRARKWWTTLTARTSSTDGYMSVENQSAKTDGNMVALTAVNTLVRALPTGVHAVLDAADIGMSGRDSGVHSGPFPPVLDGTHFTSVKAAAMAGAILPVVGT